MTQLRPITGPSPDFSIPSQASRAYLVDVATVDIAPHRYLEPEVNRLKEWAMRANIEITEETMLNSHVDSLPTGAAIGLMVGLSLLMWGGIAGLIALLM